MSAQTAECPKRSEIVASWTDGDGTRLNAERWTSIDQRKRTRRLSRMIDDFLTSEQRKESPQTKSTSVNGLNSPVFTRPPSK